MAKPVKYTVVLNDNLLITLTLEKKKTLCCILFKTQKI